MKTIFISTQDSEKIAADFYQMGHSCAVILSHGFFNNKDTYLFKKIAEFLSKKFDVISFDFRGHGKSSGRFTWTAKEKEDLSAVINETKKRGYEKVGVIGFSLGAATVLIEARDNRKIDSIIAVSTPYDFWKINYHFWEKKALDDLMLNLGRKGRGKGVRPGNLFYDKVRPLDVVASISPTPILFIHGSKDWIIKPEHSQKLYEKSDGAELIILDGGGHAEKLFDDHPERFEKICLDWFQKTL